ncbi:AraC family transcriptional regulator [Ruegeria sp. HKCCA6707]|uniref:helix-turn-helix domain-containing protein n=2 Tax=unclassified Ruegeria TaxID=2625375 RepID=UPI001C2C74E5
MASPSPIPVVSAAMVRPFIAAVERAGKDTVPLLARIGLADANLDDPDRFIPGQAWYDLANTAARRCSDPHLGFTIGSEEALDSLPNLQILRLPHATLGELLNALVIDARRITTLATYQIVNDGVTARLVTQRNFTPARPPAQVDGYFAGFMLRILRQCTGPLWDPEEPAVSLADPEAIPLNDRPGHVALDTVLSGPQFAFPAVWLLQRTDGGVGQRLHAIPKENSAFISGLRTLLERHLDQPGLTLERLAELTGLSASRMKRTLAEHGTTYAQQRDELRSIRAKKLLLTTRDDIRTIGSAVGYPDPPGFVRAFTRWTGQTPGHWRRQHSLKSSE